MGFSQISAGYMLIPSDCKLLNAGGAKMYVQQSVEDSITKCRRWKQRRKLVRELEKEGISWQIQGQRKWVAGLLRNEKMEKKIKG